MCQSCVDRSRSQTATGVLRFDATRLLCGDHHEGAGKVVAAVRNSGGRDTGSNVIELSAARAGASIDTRTAFALLTFTVVVITVGAAAGHVSLGLLSGAALSLGTAVATGFGRTVDTRWVVAMGTLHLLATWVLTL